MKAKLFIYSSILGLLILAACQKEDESKNPYLEDSDILFTPDDYAFFPYKIGDTLYYTEERVENGGVIHFKNHYYYTVTRLDTIINNVRSEYALTLSFDTVRKYKLILYKTKNGIDFLIKRWLSDSNPLFDIKGIITQYDTISINGKLYHDVYHIETDTSYNENKCRIQRFFLSSHDGIISKTERCYHNYFQRTKPEDQFHIKK